MTEQTLPDDIRAALLKDAKSFMREHYVGGLWKLREWSDYTAWFVRIYSWNLDGSRASARNRLVKLAERGVLVEVTRSERKGAVRSFTAPRPVLDEIGLEAQRYWESVGYRVGEMMEEIPQ
ncbi:MAG: hypothetical protein LBE61_00305 [Burkholderiaceae bacterium]|jgi:hypothetical protein|nr:hypothetical protein [Burkholderiaceae bacterium]